MFAHRPGHLRACRRGNLRSLAPFPPLAPSPLSPVLEQTALPGITGAEARCVYLELAPS
jgi:hypothetical protein